MSKPPLRVTLLSSIALCAVLASAALWVRPRADAADAKSAIVLASATTRSATPPAPEPSRRRVIPAMPAQFQVLLKRSIFARGGQAGADENAEAAGAATGVQYILRGVAEQEGAFVAFVESTADSRLMRLRAGDPVAKGRLSHISFNGVDFKSARGVTKVAIGCALDGSPFGSSTASGAAAPEAPDAKANRKHKKSRDAQPPADATPVPAATLATPLAADPSQKAR